MYAPASSPRLAPPAAAMRGLDVHDNPFARTRGAVGASFWNALAFAGLFASVLIGRVIVQAGQEGAQATTAPRAAAARAAAATQEPTGMGPQNSGAGGVGINALAPGAERVREEPSAAEQPAEETSPPAAEATSPPAASHPKRHATRSHSEALDWRQETPVKAEPTPLPAAKPVDPTAALGTLRINSRPWSQVFVDGRLVGNTPQLGLRLPAGRYTVRLANPELGMSKTLIVKIAPGEFVSHVETLEEP